MLLAFVVISVFHPGRLMNGAASNIPSRKERRKHGQNKAQYILSKFGNSSIETSTEMNDGAMKFQGNMV